MPKRKLTFLVTGGCGFIGSHFVDRALFEGHRVINIDKLTYAANLDLSFSYDPGQYHFIHKDIVDLDHLPSCDYIINFAAESHVDNSINSAREFLRTNIEGTYNLLDLIRTTKIENMQKSWEYKAPTFVQISTDEVFGDIEVGPGFKEEDRHKPSNPYAASKSAAEQLVVAWGRTYDIPYIITRTTNNFGPRQHEEKLIPRCIHNLLTDEKIPVHGSGEYVRNWIHVEDNVDAIMTIINYGKRNRAYHIASEEEYSVKEIVTRIAGHFGKSFDEVADMSSDRSGADVRYALVCEDTKQLGWKPRRNLLDSLEEMIESHKKTL